MYSKVAGISESIVKNCVIQFMEHESMEQESLGRGSLGRASLG